MNHENIYVIGLGKHVKNKIIPAFKNLGLNIGGIVSKNKDHDYADLSIKDFEKFKDENIKIFISGIPENHSYILSLFDLNNCNALIEKPAFVDLKDLYKFRAFINNKNISEAMMYKFSLAFRFSRFKFYLQHKAIKGINVKFLLPLDLSTLNETFRHTKNLKNSIIYDIGYYVFDILWSFELEVKKIKLKNVIWFENRILKSIEANIICYYKSKKYVINFEIGYCNKYQNLIEFKTYKSSFLISPIFSGRYGAVNYIKNINGQINKTIKSNKNSYVKLIKYWYKNNYFRNSLGLNNFERIDKILLQLNIIEKQVMKHDF